MSEQINLMNKYIADLAVLNIKFHNLHWNVVGENFEAVHEYIEKIYDDLFDKFDEVAERVKMIGEYPKASIKSYLEITTVEELGDKDYRIEETYNILKEELNKLKELALVIRKEADTNDDFVTVGLMEDHIGTYVKEIWFINSTLK